MMGPASLRVWMSTPDADDLDVFVAVEKLDAQGRRLGFAHHLESGGPALSPSCEGNAAPARPAGPFGGGGMGFRHTL